MARKSPAMTASMVYVAQCNLVLLMGHLLPAPHSPFSENMMFNEYCPTRWASIPYPKDVLVHAASAAAIPSTQGIGGTYPFSQMQSHSHRKDPIMFQTHTSSNFVLLKTDPLVLTHHTLLPQSTSA